MSDSKLKNTSHTFIIKICVLVLAFCYMISPVKSSITPFLHNLSHSIESFIVYHNSHKTSFYSHSHTHHHEAQHHYDKHSHEHNYSETGKIYHTHSIISLIDTVISATEEHDKQEAPNSKTALDKHILNPEYSFTPSNLSLIPKTLWSHSLCNYSTYLRGDTPPPKLA